MYRRIPNPHSTSTCHNLSIYSIHLLLVFLLYLFRQLQHVIIILKIPSLPAMKPESQVKINLLLMPAVTRASPRSLFNLSPCANYKLREFYWNSWWWRTWTRELSRRLAAEFREVPTNTWKSLTLMVSHLQFNTLGSAWIWAPIIK